MYPSRDFILTSSFLEDAKKGPAGEFGGCEMSGWVDTAQALVGMSLQDHSAFLPRSQPGAFFSSADLKELPVG